MLLRLHARNLRTRIIAWSFVPTTIILLAVALVTFYAYQDVTEKLVIGRNQELTRLSAGQLSTDLSEYVSLLTALARNAGIYTPVTEGQRAALKAVSNRLVVFDGGAVLLDSYGRVAAAEPERPEILGQDWSDRSYFRQMLRSPAPAFSNVVADGPGGAEVIVVAVPITGEHGEFQGTMAGMFRLGATAVSAFYGGIVKLRIGETGQVYLADGNGRVMYHSDTQRIGAWAHPQPGSFRTRDANGQDIVASSADVPGTPWVLVTEESWATLMGSSQNYREFLLVLLALGVVVPALFVTFGVRRITGPIAQLIAAAKEVAGGRFGQTISVHTGDELEELGRQFNLMSGELAESYANLERRVADRTRELAALNAIAAAVSGSLELEEILRAALDKTMEVMGTEMGGAYKLDAESRVFTLLAQRGLPEEIARRVGHLPMGVAAPRQALLDGQPVFRTPAEVATAELRELLERQGIQLVISVPLMARGKMLGAFDLGACARHEVTREEMALLAAIGQQVGVAMENAELYEQAEQTATAAERNRLARDLHDAVSQTLFSASLIAEVLPALCKENPDEGFRRLDELRQLTRGALAEMRMLLLELRPTALTDAALGDLLRHLVEATTSRAWLPVALTVDGQRALPPDVQLALYRIAQEALNNVAKHAEASQAALSLRFLPPDGAGGRWRVELCISDDGRGFQEGPLAAEHLGLGIMRERAEAVGAKLSVESRPGHGTRIAVAWEETEGMEDR